MQIGSKSHEANTDICCTHFTKQQQCRRGAQGGKGGHEPQAGVTRGAAPSNGHIIEGSSSVPQFVAAFRFITHFRHGSSDDDDDDDMGNILVC